MNLRTLCLAVMAFGLLMCRMVLPAVAQDTDSYFRKFNAAMDANEYKEAERYAKLMLTSSSTQGWKAASLNSLGRVYHNLNKLDEAEKTLLEALQIPLGGSNVNTGWIPNNLALVYLDKKKFADAETMLSRALLAFERIDGAQSTSVATIQANLGQLYHDQERYDESEQYYLKAWEMRVAILGKVHSQVANSLASLADVSRHQQKFELSEKRYLEALALREKLYGADHAEVAKTLHSLGVMHRDQSRFEKAEEVDRRGLAIREKVFGPNHLKTKHSLEQVAEDLDQLGKKDDAAVFRQRAKAISETATPDSPTRLKVISETANFQDGTVVAGTAKKGEEFKILDINGPWYAVEFKDATGKAKTGWLNGRHVQAILGEKRTQEGSPQWIAFSPPRSRLSIWLPGSPQVTKQAMSGMEAIVYTYSSPQAEYTVTYFDIPTDRVLTFDAAKTALATARKGTVESEKTLEKDRFPGRELVLKLPDKGFSRMQMFQVNRRWYVLQVDGRSGETNDKSYDQFFQSFSLTD